MTFAKASQFHIYLLWVNKQPSRGLLCDCETSIFVSSYIVYSIYILRSQRYGGLGGRVGCGPGRGLARVAVLCTGADMATCCTIMQNSHSSTDVD